MTDAQLALQSGTFGAPGQFGDAYNFVKQVICQEANYDPTLITEEELRLYIEGRANDSNTANDITFTGHSLGGALAQYITWKTGQDDTTADGTLGAKAVTFKLPELVTRVLQKTVPKQHKLSYC